MTRHAVFSWQTALQKKALIFKWIASISKPVRHLMLVAVINQRHLWVVFIGNKVGLSHHIAVHANVIPS